MKIFANRRYNLKKRIFTLMIILFPIISIYSSPIEGASIADILLILSFPIFSIGLIELDWPINKSFSFYLIYYIVFLVFNLFISLALAETGTFLVILLSSIKYILYLTFIALFTKTFLDKDLALKGLKNVSLFASGYLIIQYITYTVFGSYLPGTIPFLRLQSSGIENLNSLYKQGFKIRMNSIFSEPAHFATYVLIFLVIDLMAPKKKTKEYIPSIIVSIAILLSESSTGIITCGFIWFLWALKKIVSQREKSKERIIIFVLIVLSPVLYYFLLKTDSFNTFINRTYSNGQLGTAALGRIGNVNFSQIWLNSSSVDVLFGKGMVNLDFYMPGFARALYYYGIIGSIVLYITILLIYNNLGKNLRPLMVVFLILNIGTEMMFGGFIMLYFSFMIYDKETNQLPFENGKTLNWKEDKTCKQ
jgi:hypothetical protein